MNCKLKNSGRDPFPIFLKRRKLPRKFSITQPGNISEADFYKDSDLDVTKNFLTLAQYDFMGIQQTI